MDWLEEKKEQLKCYLHNESFLKSFLIYILIGVIVSVVLSLFISNICRTWIEVLANRSGIEPGAEQEKWLFLETYVNKNRALQFLTFTKRYVVVINLIIMQIVVPICYYQINMKPIFKSVKEFMRYISLGDYSYELSTGQKSELGVICSQFEVLRKELINEKKIQWKESEKQREVNAAFAHDIRTPITIMRGYTEMLQKYIPQEKLNNEQVLEKLQLIHEQQNRILEFSKTMTTIQKMEQWDYCCKEITGEQLNLAIKTASEGMDLGNKVSISLSTTLDERDTFLLDEPLILEVLHNLLSNAVQYAVSIIEVTAGIETNNLVISVKDDGTGFSDRALYRACETYYSEKKDSSDHFGIGLSIASMLCERHKGNLKVMNSINGGAICMASFSIM